MLMSLGQFIFKTSTLAFQEIQRQRSWSYAENAVANGRAKKQFTGAGSDTVTMPGLIFGTRFALDELASMADTGQGYVLMDGSGYLYGVFVIDSIDETKSILMDNGVPRKVDYTLKLSRVDDERIEMQSAPQQEGSA